MALFVKPKLNPNTTFKGNIDKLIEFYQPNSPLKTVLTETLMNEVNTDNYSKFLGLIESLKETNEAKMELLSEATSTIKDASILTKEATLLEAIINTTYEYFQEDLVGIIKDISNFAERKLKGYSPGQVDRLINKASNINSEEKKASLIKEIDTAIADAKDSFKSDKESANPDQAKQDALKYQVEILTKLKEKIRGLNVIDNKLDNIDKEHENQVDLDSM